MSEDSRWDWSAARILVAALWIGLTLGLGLYFWAFVYLATGELFGEGPSAQHLQEATVATVIAGLLIAAGPFGIWRRSHQGVWLYGTIGVLLIHFLVAATLYVRSLGAPS